MEVVVGDMSVEGVMVQRGVGVGWHEEETRSAEMEAREAALARNLDPEPLQSALHSIRVDEDWEVQRAEMQAPQLGLWHDGGWKEGSEKMNCSWCDRVGPPTTLRFDRRSCAPLLDSTLYSPAPESLQVAGEVQG